MGKTGSMAPAGVNSTIETLDRVRVDSAGQVLTTNQGVPIADNQNSLKMGLPDPGIFKDSGDGAAVAAFIKAVAPHWHPERETDPPLV